MSSNGQQERVYVYIFFYKTQKVQLSEPPSTRMLNTVNNLTCFNLYTKQ